MKNSLLKLDFLVSAANVTQFLCNIFIDEEEILLANKNDNELLQS